MAILEYYVIFGEVYILKDRESLITGNERINSLDLLRSDMVKPYFDSFTGEIVKVEYKTAKGTATYQSEEIIYYHNPDPANPLRGESLYRSGIRQIETSTQIDEYHSKILENGGMVDGVFTFKSGSLNKNQLIELKEQYQEEYGNASKAGLPMFLSGDADYKKLSLTPTELAYLETKKVTLNDIVIMSGVPKAILGSTSDETFNNNDAAIRIFYIDTIKPLINSLVETLNEKLVPKEFELTYIDKTPENKDEKRKDLETSSNIYAITTNEKREQLGLDPIKGGDNILVPLNLVPMNGTETNKQIKKKIIKSPACRQSGETKAECVARKIPELIDEGYDKDQAVAVANSICSYSCKTKIYHPLREKENRLLYHALQMKRLDRRTEKFKNVINIYFDGQRDRLIDSLSERKQFKLKSILGEIFNTMIEIKLAKETVLPILSELLKEAGEDSKEIAGSDWDFNETPEITSWLDKRTSIFAETINDTTFNKLKKEFQESLDNGETRKELIERIENTYENISKKRAEVIARTEVHGVTQYGTFQGYKQASLPIKIWTWSPGTKGGVRENHQAMDGEERAIDETFSNGLMFPGEGSASEVINCQCVI